MRFELRKSGVTVLFNYAIVKGRSQKCDLWCRGAKPGASQAERQTVSWSRARRKPGGATDIFLLSEAKKNTAQKERCFIYKIRLLIM